MRIVIPRRLLAVLAAFLAVAGLCVAADAAAAPKARASNCTITADASAPAAVELTSTASATATTASFSPPANSLVVVEVSIKYDSGTPTGPTVTVTDSGNNSYTATASAYDGVSSGTYQFERYFATAPGSGTVIAHRAGQLGAAMYFVKTYVLDGAAVTQNGGTWTASQAGSGSTSVTKAVAGAAADGDVILASDSIGRNESQTASGLTTDTSWADATDSSGAATGHVYPTGSSGTIGWTLGTAATWSFAATDILPAATCGLLTWSPPACGDGDGLTCTTINLANTGSHQTENLNIHTDYKLVLPASGALVGGLTISGGHNVQIIGGEIDVTYPCANDTDACMGIYLVPGQQGETGSAGEFYMEGVWIHNSHTIPSSCSPSGQPCSTGDGMDVDNGGGSSPGFTYNVTLQNDRIDGISGCSGGGDHADVLQPYQAAGTTFDIDHLTGTTNCQGMQIDPNLGAGANAPVYAVKNANIDITSNPYAGNNDRYGWWFTDTCTSGAVSLTNTYEQEPDGSLASNAVWPDTSTSGCQSTYSAPTLTFHNTSITGVMTSGQPSGGDYVTGGGTGAGTGYVSPGYQ